MENFLTYALYTKLAIMVIYILHALRGPSVWDRLMGMNLVATKTIMVIVVFASINETAYLLDLAILFALFGFIGTIFIALFISKYRLGKMRQSKGGKA